MTWLLSFESPDSFILIINKWLLIIISFTYTLRVYLLNAYLSMVHTKSKVFYSTLNSLVARGYVVQAKHRQILLLMIESISGYYNHMAYRDSFDGIVEQMDVVRSILTTGEFFLLMPSGTNFR